MKSLYILVMMQLKEQMNLSRHNDEKKKFFLNLLSVVGEIAKFAAVTVLCFAFMYAGGILGVGGISSYIPDTMISFVFSIMLIMAMISCTFGLTKSLYYARDNAVLLTLPCTPIQVYLSKLIIFFFFEIKRNFSFLVPMFIAYFIHRNMAAGSFSFKDSPTYDNLPFSILWLIAVVVVLSLCTVAIGAILSIPAMWIANFYRQHKKLQITSVVITVIAVVSGFVAILFAIPKDIDIARDWTQIFTFVNEEIIEGFYIKNFDFLYQLSKLILGDIGTSAIAEYTFAVTATRFGILFGIAAVTLGLGFLLVRPLFYKMASTPFEYLKKEVKPKKNRKKGRLFSSIYTNYLIILKNSNEIFYNLGILFSVPMLIFVLNTMFKSMDVSTNGFYMIVAVNILIVLIILLNSNCTFASIFSRDGQSRYLIKTIPANYSLPIITKMIPNMTFAVLSGIATSFVFYFTIGPGAMVEKVIEETQEIVMVPRDPALKLTEVILLSVGILFIYVAHALYSAELDLMNPKHQLYASVGSSVSNPNEMKSTTTAFLIPFFIAGAILLLLFEQKGWVFEKLLAVSAAVLAYRIWMFFTTLRLYYKEK